MHFFLLGGSRVDLQVFVHDVAPKSYRFHTSCCLQKGLPCYELLDLDYSHLSVQRSPDIRTSSS